MAIVFFRTLIIYITLSVFMRILGKRQFGELELSELVVALLIADLAALPLQDIGIPLLNGLLSIVILFCLELVVTGITLRSVPAAGGHMREAQPARGKRGRSSSPRWRKTASPSTS